MATTAAQHDPYAVPLEQIDMSNPVLFEQNLARTYFERLRTEAPVHYSKGSDCGPFWSVTRFQDIIEIDKNHKLFSADSAHGGHLLGYEMWFESDPDLQLPMIIAMDPRQNHSQGRESGDVVCLRQPRRRRLRTPQ